VISGAIVFEATVAANSEGYAQALELVDAHAAARRAFAVEGTGSFGAGLTRFLSGRGEGERQELQALVAAREGAVNAKRAALCQLRDLLITNTRAVAQRAAAAVEASLAEPAILVPGNIQPMTWPQWSDVKED
jgi:transposase